MAQGPVIPAALENHPELLDIIQFYQTNNQHIRTCERRGPVLDVYNFSLEDELVAPEVLTQTVFQQQTFCFKVNASCGVILRNSLTGELKYYYPCWNNAPLLEEAHTITHLQDWRDFVSALSDVDYVDANTAQRPNTQWTLVWITNLTLYVFKLQNRLLGAPPPLIPDFLNHNKGLVGLFKYRGEPYQDNLCLFRAYAYHTKHPRNSLERATKDHLHTFATHQGLDVFNASPKHFPGTRLGDLGDFEDVFKVNVTVFSLTTTPDENGVRATLQRRSLCKYTDTMYLNVYEGHFSYIKDLQKYAGCFVCVNCNKHFPTSRLLCDHTKKCKGAASRLVFRGGVYHPSPTLKEKLDLEGISLPKELQFHPHRIVFDIESYFPKELSVEAKNGCDKLSYTDTHVPLSVSICSNVEGHIEPQCLVTDGDSQALIDRMIEAMLQIQIVSEEQLKKNAEPVFAAIHRRLAQISETDDAAERHPLHQTNKCLEKFVKTIPVIGFSSGRYDLNVLRPYLLKYFDGSTSLVIKRTNQFLVLSNDRLKFLDIQTYLAPGYTYKQYLAAYDCSETKSFFPYQWVTHLARLQEPQLPPRDAFYSDLTGKTISEEEYAHCQQVWVDKEMVTFRDWLVHYNNLDVKPFVEALEKQCQFFCQHNLDMFFDAISLPGLTDRFLHKTTPPGTFFKLFNEKNSDLYHSFRSSVCGGPSIVFSRHHNKGETYLRSAEPDKAPHRLCQTIEGYDANSLYLKCLAEPMPVGFYYRRKVEDGFRLESSHQQSMGCLEWLTYVERTEGRDITHEFKTGKERTVGGRKIRVDGYDPINHLAYQFDGCYYHGHDCHLTRRMDPELKQKRAEHTKQVATYLSKIGCRVTTMRECEWQAQKRANPNILSMVGDVMPTGEAWKPGKMTMEALKVFILSGELFGVAEVDIVVPEHLKSRFQEFCPIFKNAMVDRTDLGGYMEQFATENGMMKQPRRCLISSFKATKTMIITPLLRWYLEQGLQITHIHQVVQYQSSTCFDAFAAQVTEARREADSDPAKAIIGSAFKLLGNSSYGRSLMRKDKHLNVRVVDEAGAREAINSPYFRNMVQINETHYEAQFRKKRVQIDLPIQIGIFVYGYAKLRLLKFYYEFVDVYVDRRDFEVVTCDTDSLYLALSGSCLEDVIKPEKKEHFLRHRDEWLPTRRCHLHKGESVDANAETSPPPCCFAAHKHQTREPGLWKLEAKADRIIALAPKCYICCGDTDKVSCKGVQKKINPLTIQHFERVLKTQEQQSVVNRGFRLDKNNQMRSYQQPKRGLSFLYTKRQVLGDGVSTIPLDL